MIAKDVIEKNFFDCFGWPWQQQKKWLKSLKKFFFSDAMIYQSHFKIEAISNVGYNIIYCVQITHKCGGGHGTHTNKQMNKYTLAH